MSTNPLFPSSDEPAKDDTDPAVALIRSKVSRAYTAEPSATQELAEVQVTEQVLSKHQQYMRSLSGSGKSLAEIQTAWHEYYTALSDTEKHEVWQEFYAANQHTPYQKLFQKQQQTTANQNPLVPAPASFQPVTSENGVVVANHMPAAMAAPKKPMFDGPAVRQIKQKLSSTMSANGQLTLKHHLQSLGFGLATGMVVLMVFLFTFFNEYIIAPFIQPSRSVSSTPIILTGGTVAADAPPSVTIPKINIQIPLNFSVTSYNEADVENGLKDGVVHYPNTVMPGQNGNAAYFGHSSGNIFNNGKYKFAFTLLHDLTTGDLFYITYGGKTYAYRIFARQIVPPSDVGVINDTQGKQATATLITCDPPGISTNRLVLWGEQISPNPSTNTAAPVVAATGQPSALADNGPSLWSRFVGWVEFWN